MTAVQFLKTLKAHQSEKERENVQRFYRGEDPETDFLGVRFGTVFNTAKTFTDMSLDHIETLLENKFYEVRMGAVSIMDFQARQKKTNQERKKELYKLYLRRHDRINNWDLVDRAAPNVLGGYLYDKPRAKLYQLAKSANVWERRSAIVSTYYFIRRGDTQDTFNIAGMLIGDNHDLIQKAVGSWLREAGKKDEQGLKRFLDQYAVNMAAVTLRYAMEKLDESIKVQYRRLNRDGS